MAKTIEHIHWPNAPDMWMPYAPAIKVRGGTTIYLAGVTAAPVYHHHPHRPEEFDAMPQTMEGQARAALENLKRGLEAVGATFADVVKITTYVKGYTPEQRMPITEIRNRYLVKPLPASTLVGVETLVHDDFLIEVEAIAVVG